MLNTLWLILFCILMLTGILVYYSAFHNWSIKAKIFLCVSQLCLCSVLVVLGFCSNQSFTTNLVYILAILVLLKILKNQLNKLEKQATEKALETQKESSQKPQVIDAEGFTVCD